MPAAEFEAIAQDVFRHQAEANTAYGAYCRSLGRVPGTVGDWREIPPVPAKAFKSLDLYSGLPGEDAGGRPRPPQAVFQTSGTTGGGEKRGRHPVASLELYRDASMPWFGRNLIPEDEPLPILALLPSPAAAPSSSLSRMAGDAVNRWGDPGSRFLADPVSGVDHAGVREALEWAEGEGRPVLLLGTAFAWVHWLEWAESRGHRFRLPSGSRLMETGGFKGRARAVPRDELYRRLEVGLGVPTSRIVNEYGMTELLSQMYEPVLASVDGPPGRRIHRAPPWLGIQVLDPETLEPRPRGEVGLLAFMDLANVGSVSAVLTEDLGHLDSRGGLRLLGRVPGAEPRGCSLALEGVLEAQS
jgi:hypothetical protein